MFTCIMSRLAPRGETLQCHSSSPQQLFTLHSAPHHRIYSVCKDLQRFKSCVWESPFWVRAMVHQGILNMKDPSYSAPARTFYPCSLMHVQNSSRAARQDLTAVMETFQASSVHPHFSVTFFFPILPAQGWKWDLSYVPWSPPAP